MEEDDIFGKACLEASLSLQPHQRARATLPTPVGGLGLASAERRRVAAYLGSLCETLPAVLVSVQGSLWDRVRKKLPRLPLVRIREQALRSLAEEWEVKEEEQATVLPPGLTKWAYGDTDEERALPVPSMEVLRPRALWKRRTAHAGQTKEPSPEGGIREVFNLNRRLAESRTRTGSG